MQLNLTLTITPDAKGTEILDAFCAEYGYDVASGITKLAFWKQQVIEFSKAPWLAQRKEAIDKAGREALLAESNSVTMTA